MRAEIYLAVLTLLLSSAYSRAEEDGPRIFEHRGRDGVTNEWRLSFEHVLKSPKWDPLKSEAPISVTNAVAIAHNWITKHKGIVIWDPDLRVDSIAINSLHRDDPVTKGVFYYIIIFRNGEFDSTACVVLMDGSVLEPQKKRQHERMP